MITNKIKSSFVVIAIAILFTSCNQAKMENTDIQKELAELKLQNQRLVDESDIKNLIYLFSDAANRKDGEQFQSLWSANALWKIGPPINMEFKGKENMGSSVTRMLGLWDFFVQMPNAIVIKIDGNKATARVYVNEVARKSDDKHGNYNLSMYDDELVKENGKWFFEKRTYHTVYQDAPDHKGLVQELPKF